jgi:ribosomal protein L7/L12
MRDSGGRYCTRQRRTHFDGTTVNAAERKRVAQRLVGRTIGAIKAYRARTGTTLREAKDAIESYRDRSSL